MSTPDLPDGMASSREVFEPTMPSDDTAERREFAMTFDYRCPFARAATDHVITAIEAGLEVDARFVPFSLSQSHVEPGQLDVWDDPESDSGLYALQTAVVVRDTRPDRFLAVHRALFEVRHQHGERLRGGGAFERALTDNDVDIDGVDSAIADGWPLERVREEHEWAVRTHDVWGVPTFIAAERAAFVRLMERPEGDDDLACRTVSGILDMLVGWISLNEFKHTSLDR